MAMIQGRVLLFSQYEFEGYEPRLGFQNDADRIGKTFSRLGFAPVETFVNYTTDQVMDALTEASRFNYSNFKCVVIIIISHFPCIGSLLSKDGSYSENSVIEKFTGSKNTTLHKIPKLFFFQALQGREIKIESDLEVDSTPFTENTALPRLSDLFILRSICEGAPTHQAQDGSWFIQVLCTYLELYSKTEFFQDIMTALMDLVQQEVTDTRIPEITSSLTVPLKFEGCKDGYNPGPINLRKYERYPKVGKLFIFAYTEVFDDIYGETCKRNCAKDVQYLEETFENLGFTVEIYIDELKDNVLRKLKEASDYKDDTCVAVAFITHAVDDMLGTSNYPFHEDELYRCFSDSKHADLKGKPKFFIIQTCIRTDIFNPLETVSVKPTKRFALEEDDILVLYIHQVNNYVARTCNNKDSFMIEKLCSQIKQATLNDEASLIDIVNGFQATILKYITDVGGRDIGSRNRQLPYICSTLTKKLLIKSQKTLNVNSLLNDDNQMNMQD